MAETNKAIAKVVKGIQAGRADAPHPSEIAELMGKKFNGTQGFVDQWFEQMQQACIENPGSKTALDGFHRLYEIFSESAEKRELNADVAELTAEQIEIEMRVCCLRMLNEDRQLLVSLLDEMGLDIVPKSGDEIIRIKTDGTPQ